MSRTQSSLQALREMSFRKPPSLTPGITSTKVSAFQHIPHALPNLNPFMHPHRRSNWPIMHQLLHPTTLHISTAPYSAALRTPASSLHDLSVRMSPQTTNARSSSPAQSPNACLPPSTFSNSQSKFISHLVSRSCQSNVMEEKKQKSR